MCVFEWRRQTNGNGIGIARRQTATGKNDVFASASSLYYFWLNQSFGISHGWRSAYVNGAYSQHVVSRSLSLSLVGCCGRVTNGTQRSPAPISFTAKVSSSKVDLASGCQHRAATDSYMRYRSALWPSPSVYSAPFHSLSAHRQRRQFFCCLFVRSQWNSITNAIPFCYVVCCEEWRRNVCVEQHNAHSYSDTLSTFRTKYKTQDACYLYILVLYCSCIWSKKVDGEWWGFDTPSLAFSFVWCMTMCYVYISAIIELLLPYQISETLPGCTGYAILWFNIQWVFLFFFFVFFFIFFLL